MVKDADTYYPKYITIRRSSCLPGETPEILDPNTTFTLVPGRDPAAKTALRAYADSCEEQMPGLATALRQHFDL